MTPLQPNSAAKSFKVANSLVVLNGNGQKLFLLNPTARFIFENRSKNGDIEKLVVLYSQQFGVDRKTAHHDITKTIAQWKKKGLIRALREKPSVNMTPPASTTHTHWSVSAPYRFFNTSFTLSASATSLIDEIHPLISQWKTSQPAKESVTIGLSKGVYTVGRNGRLVGETLLKHEAVGLVLQEIINILHPQCRWMAVLHGSAVAKNNRAVLFSAQGGSGKSSLAVSLMANGFQFISDDTIPIEEQRQNVMPAPFNICLKKGSWEVLSCYFPEILKTPVFQRYDRQVRYLQPDLPKSPAGGIPVKAIIFSQYRPGAAGQLRKVAADTALEMIVLSGAWISHDPVIFVKMIRFLQSVPAYELKYDSFDNAMKTIATLVSQ